MVFLSTDNSLAAELATKKWMDRLIKVSKAREDSVKDTVCQLIDHIGLVDWQSRYHDDAQFIEFNIAYLSEVLTCSSTFV